ncbi:MAG TPA: PBSX family phage terminase large subunit [Candidatus Limiplasma sp.]|nr:PBSX family phage terminase large subunit [Candidatus Limiplasma sp.]
MTDVRLSRLIAESFFSLWRAARAGKVDELWLQGGRGSGKTSFAAICILCGLMDEPEANAIVYRKVADTLRESVYAHLVWAIGLLGVSEWFKLRLSPLEIEYTPTGQRILFRGSDKPEKSKGVKLQKGYFKYLWFEELTEFSGMQDIRTIKASILRGTQQQTLTICTYNPPQRAAHWVNREARTRRKGRRIHHSDYRSIPRAWLGDAFLLEAEALMAQNPREYRHMYLGEVTGTGAQVFENLKLKRLPPKEWEGLRSYCGLDFGFASDPDAFVRCAYDGRRRILYIVDEFVSLGLLSGALAGAVKSRAGEAFVTCDSAEPRSIAELRSRGVRVTPARKGPDSVAHGMKWLQSRAMIVIDPKRTPLAAEEFSCYEYERDKAGEPLPFYPDRNNHLIDAVRYAMESVSAVQRAIIPR